MKYIFLFCLFFSHAYIPAQLGQDKLEKLMRDNFGLHATPENILNARNERGESILHIIYQEVVKASNSQEISSLAEAKDVIPDKIGYQLERNVDKEGHSIVHFTIKIAKENVSFRAIDKLDVFCGYVERYKNIRRPCAPCQGCSWINCAKWTAGGVALALTAVAQYQWKILQRIPIGDTCI